MQAKQQANKGRRMDLSVRDWLIIIGALLAIAVLLDGFRRMRNERRETLRLASMKRREAEVELSNPELASEARVVAVRESSSLHQRDAVQAPARSHAADRGVEEDDDDVLMRAVSPVKSSAPVDVGDDSDLRLNDDSLASQAGDDAGADERLSEPRVYKREPAAAKVDSAQSAASKQPQELIVLKVLADADKPYQGADLLQVLLACDLRYGRMNIFHRFEKADGSGAEQFSVANLVEPGSFDLDAIEGFSTPGVVFFLSLPGPEESMQAFDAMLETARCLVKNLGGELRDQSHSVATKQTYEHYRQRIRDFERRQLTLM